MAYSLVSDSFNYENVVELDVGNDAHRGLVRYGCGTTMASLPEAAGRQIFVGKPHAPV
jgi:ribonucleotide monophosphatase NagD (HAD superfamily)